MNQTKYDIRNLILDRRYSLNFPKKYRLIINILTNAIKICSQSASQRTIKLTIKSAMKVFLEKNHDYDDTSTKSIPLSLKPGCRVNNLGRIRAPKPRSLKFSRILRRQVVAASHRERDRRRYKYVYASLDPAGAAVYTIIRVPFHRGEARRAIPSRGRKGGSARAGGGTNETRIGGTRAADQSSLFSPSHVLVFLPNPTLDRDSPPPFGPSHPPSFPT